MWFTAMLLKQIGSWERAPEVTHRRAVVFETIPGAGRHHHRTSFTHCAAAPATRAQLLHVDLSRFSGNRMYTETQASMRRLLFQKYK